MLLKVFEYENDQSTFFLNHFISCNNQKTKKNCKLRVSKEGFLSSGPFFHVYTHAIFMIPTLLFYEVNDPLLQVCYKS